jgi:hypothetical protein
MEAAAKTPCPESNLGRPARSLVSSDRATRFLQYRHIGYIFLPVAVYGCKMWPYFEGIT